MLTMRNERLRQTIRWTVPFVLIPLLALAGAYAADERRVLVLAVAAAALSLLLFAAGFERRRTGTRRIVIVAVMTALCFAGRFLPILKPIQALTILTALYIGREAGFLVGALSAVLSNLYFGQGPWTVFQMLAWGLIGYFAGILAEPLKRRRAALLVYGIVCGVLYSFIMDIWTVLWDAGTFVPKLYLAALVTAIPYTVSYVLANVLFLTVLARPFGEKLERIRVKYGV